MAGEFVNFLIAVPGTILGAGVLERGLMEGLVKFRLEKMWKNKALGSKKEEVKGLANSNPKFKAAVKDSTIDYLQQEEKFFRNISLMKIIAIGLTASVPAAESLFFGTTNSLFPTTILALSLVAPLLHDQAHRLSSKWSREEYSKK